MSFMTPKTTSQVGKSNAPNQKTEIFESSKSTQEEINQLKIRIRRDDLSIKEHLYYLKRDAILKNSFSVITILTSLFKKLQE